MSTRVILCDLMMPQVTGMDLHAELVASSPELAAHLIFMTGAAFTPASRDLLDRVPNLRIEKPFSKAALQRLVAQALH